MITYIKGDLLDSTCNYICHQVNCQGVMGSGIANQIRNKWPEVYTEYLEVCKKVLPSKLLSDVQCIQIAEWYEDGELVPNGQWVVNMFAQENYGYDKSRYTSYDAFWNCLNLLKSRLRKNSTVAFPKNIGCGLGGANWDIIEKMIDTVLKDYSVYIYEYEMRGNKNA